MIHTSREVNVSLVSSFLMNWLDSLSKFFLCSIEFKSWGQWHKSVIYISYIPGVISVATDPMILKIFHIYIMDTIGNKRDPIASPSFCRNISESMWKYFVWTNKIDISIRLILVITMCSPNAGSDSCCSLINWMTLSLWILIMKLSKWQLTTTVDKSEEGQWVHGRNIINKWQMKIVRLKQN